MNPGAAFGLLASRLLVEPRYITMARVMGEPPDEEPGWGPPPEPVVIAEFPVFAHRETAAEKVRAGRETATASYTLYALMPLPDGVTERKTLRLSGEARVLPLNIRSIAPRPTEGLVIVEADGSKGGASSDAAGMFPAANLYPRGELP